MTGKKDDACGGDSGLEHDVDPMRHLGGHGPAGYSSGPTHTDRADFTAPEASGDAATEATTDADAEPKAEDDKPAT